MRRPRRRRAAPATVARPSEDPIVPGDVVTLPDGGVAAVEKLVGADAYVIEWQKPSARGPWIFPVRDLARLS